MVNIYRIFIGISILALVSIYFSDEIREKKFELEYARWIKTYKQEAYVRLNLSEDFLNEVFDNAKPLYFLLKLNQLNQEDILKDSQIGNSLLNSEKITAGKEFLVKHNKELTNIEKKYKVARSLIVAFLGIQSNYGKNIDNYNALSVISTLAVRDNFAFYKKELDSLLLLIYSNNLSIATVASFEGKLGVLQFLPSDYKAYGVTAKSNSIKVDLFNNQSDIFLTVANFLKQMGWGLNVNPKIGSWGYKVIPPNNNANLSLNEQTLSTWKIMGYKLSNGQALPDSNATTTLVIPSNIQGVALLANSSFYNLIRWNNSLSNTISIALLSEELQEYKSYMDVMEFNTDIAKESVDDSKLEPQKDKLFEEYYKYKQDNESYK